MLDKLPQSKRLAIAVALALIFFVAYDHFYLSKIRASMEANATAAQSAQNTAAPQTSAAGAGAQQVFDYHDLEPSDIPGCYDVVVDTAGTDASAYRGLLRPGGRMAAIAPGAFWDILKSLLSPGPVIRMVSGKPNAKDLAWLAAKVNTGELKPILAATYPLDRIAEAHRDAENLSAAGKRVVLAQ